MIRLQQGKREQAAGRIAIFNKKEEGIVLESTDQSEQGGRAER